MPPVVDQLRRRANVHLAGFTLGQKVMTALAVLGLVIGALMFSSWAGKPTYSMLFTNLAASDASGITQKLTSDKVPYQLADGGQTIMVPQGQVYAERIKLSAAGLPAGGQVGYSLLDKQGITTSQFTQQVDFQRALEGELSKTISSIQGVSATTVHLVIPPTDVFADTTQKPSASVLIQNTPGTTLTAGQVQAVVHLVASAVANLDPTEVTVADAKGTMLWAPGTDGQTAAAGDQRQTATVAYQDTLSQSIQQMLSSVIGPNHAVVRVTADLSYDQTATTTETFANPNQVQLNTTTDKENYLNGSSGPAGGPLTATPVTTIPGAAGNGNYTKDASAITYAPSKVTAVTTKAPGSVNRLSVAVAVDSKLTGVNVQTLQGLVSAAAGTDQTRGDTVVVSLVPFDTTAQKAATKELNAAAAAKSQAGLLSLIRTAALVLVLLGVFIVLLLASRRSARRVPIVLGPDLALEAGRVMSNARALTEDTDDRLALPPPPLIGSPINALIDSQPDQVAELLRGWMADRRS
jgi:flagellar M-ring protein FliF